MPFVAVPNAAEFVVRAEISGSEVFNTFVGVHTTTFDLDMLTVAAEMLALRWHDHMLPLLHDDYVFVDVHARGLRTAVDIEYVATDHGGVGSNSGAPLPNNVALCVSRRTGLAGRSARGRVFIGGIPASALDSPVKVLSSYSGSVVAALDGIRADWVDADWLEVVVSRVTNGVLNTPPVSRLVTAYVATDLNLDSQRRRLAGRGA